MEKYSNNGDIQEQTVKDALKKIGEELKALAAIKVETKEDFKNLVKEYGTRSQEIAKHFKVVYGWGANLVKEAMKNGIPPRMAFQSVFGVTIEALKKLNPLGIVKEMNENVRVVMEARKECMVFALKMQARVMCLACKADKSEFTVSNAMKFADSTCSSLTDACLPFIVATASSKKYTKRNIERTIQGVKDLMEALKGAAAEVTAYKNAAKDKKGDAMKKLQELKKNVVAKVDKNPAMMKLLMGKQVGGDATANVKKLIGCAPGTETCKPLCNKVFNRAKGGLDVKLIRQFIKDSRSSDDRRVLVQERVLQSGGAALESDKYKTDMETKAEAFPETTSAYKIYGAKLGALLVAAVSVIALLM